MADETDTADADEYVSESKESEESDVDDEQVVEADEAEKADEIHDDESQSADQPARRRKRVVRRRLSDVQWALAAGAVVVAMLAGLVGWSGYHAYEKHEAQVKRDLFIHTARQGAVNLTTIDFSQIEGDVQRILDLSTGSFRDDFAKR